MKLYKEPKSFLLVLAIAIGIIVLSLYSVWSPVVVTYKGKQALPIYAAPKITSVIVGTIPEGRQVKIYKINKKWMTIIWKNQKAYIVNTKQLQ